ncbi:unnamed protein product [Dovyalis caffra]|uniref:Uncharacterized protein n=1 Tax=Dovyalis caffra TaxID=77055 RepID=A0AAV1RIT7_9ROSI|nr:unnamed protein product [Dovyalis caffra]
MGNELCGPLLSKNRSGDGTTQDPKNGRNEDGNGMEFNWFYVSMASGFIVGFWSTIGSQNEEIIKPLVNKLIENLPLENYSNMNMVFCAIQQVLVSDNYCLRKTIKSSEEGLQTVSQAYA